MNPRAGMRDLGLSIAMVLVLGCGGRPAATVMSGDVPSGGACSVDVTCNGGGGNASLLEPLAILGATALGVAAIAYAYHLVWPDVRVTTSDPP